MTKFISVKVLAAFLLCGSVSTANAILADTSGIWSDVVPEAATIPGLNGLGTDTVAWGVPFIPDNPDELQSSYNFAGVNGAVINPDGMLYEIGTFTHNNFTITRADQPWLDMATLDITISFDGGAAEEMFSLVFDHTETPNTGVSGNCPFPTSGRPCSDQVVLPDAGFMTSIDGTQFLAVFGFSQDGGMTITDAFITEEDQPNSAALFISLREIVELNEPATVALLGLGILGFGLYTRRRG